MFAEKDGSKKEERGRGSSEEEDGKERGDEGGRSDICDKIDLLPFKMKRAPNF